MQANRPARPNETSEWALTVVGGPSAGVAAALVRGHVGHAAPRDAAGYSGRTMTTRLTAVP